MTYRSSKSVHVCGLGASRRIMQKNLKNIPKKPQHVISRVRPDHLRCRSATWICMCGHTRDPIIYSNFHRNLFKGFGTPGGQNLAFPITLASRFYNSLYYRIIKKQKLASVSLHCKSRRSKTANIKILSANSKHRR